MQNNHEKLAWRLLETLYEVGRADIAATPEVLASWLDVPETRVQELLRRLDAQGLVDAARCRLSMQGLVLAVSMHGAQKLARHLTAA
jgi:Mn-dependent DtxR family transcriptional regulator